MDSVNGGGGGGSCSFYDDTKLPHCHSPPQHSAQSQFKDYNEDCCYTYDDGYEATFKI
jgi:hypothetical protein